MKAYVAITEKTWFGQLKALSRREHLDEVNFWRPNKRGGRFKALKRGQPLLFKLRSPDNAVVGGGFFKRYSEFPISVAWQEFGEKNGTSSLAELQQRIAQHRRNHTATGDYTVGCILLAEPFFWEEKDWIPQPKNWKGPIQQGKRYDLQSEIGRELWTQVSVRLCGTVVSKPNPRSWVDLPGGYGDPVLVRSRVGQKIFRAALADVYERQCAVTREKAFPALEAAHIRPFKKEQEHHVRNGLLLRSDIHKLFDAGYVTVKPDFRFEVSDHLRTDFGGGEHYYKLDGTKLWIPKRPEDQPDRKHLEWHIENRFRG